MKRLLTCVLPVLLLGLPALRADSFESEFSSTSLMEREATLVVQLLEHAHYSKNSISELDPEELLTRYMEELDHARLFFTREDHDEILERFAPEIEFGLYQGDMAPAFAVFSRYKNRAQDRLAWVLARLEDDFDLTTDLEYRPDRRDTDWPENAAESQELWEKRVKHEVLQMVLNNERIETAVDTIEDRYGEWEESGEAIDDEAVKTLLREIFEEDDEEDEAMYRRILELAGESGPGLSERNAGELTSVVRQAGKEREMEQALERVERRYDRMQQNISEIDAVEIQEVFLTTLTKMFDPHSTFLSANTLEDFGISMRLSLVGIGAILTTEDGYCVIRELVPGGPADLTGRLQPEDRIVAVAQEGEEPVDVVDMKLRRVVNMIRGEQGTEVTLTVIPADAPDPSVREEVTIVRDEVKLTARQARGKVYEYPLDNGDVRSLGVIEIPSFYGSGDTETSTTEDVKELIGKMKDTGIDGLVLDLRRNGGGLLSEAINMTGLFIEAGPVVKVRDSSGNVRVDPVPDNGLVYEGPLSILVSKNSASASEIVAGALQNYRRAVVVGESSTHGKGTVQAVFELDNYLRIPRSSANNTGATKLTVQKFYLPDGASTQKRGMIPDIVIPSFNDFLPIGESSLDNAMEWDTLDNSNWEEYQKQAAVSFPINDERRSRIVDASKQRQESLEEFRYWNENIDWFRERQEQKSVSLNLEKRRAQRESDRRFREAMNEREDRLAREKEFPFTEVNLDSVENEEQPAYPPDRERPGPRDLEAPDADEDRERLDIHLRESLRVLNDVIGLEKEHRDAVAAAR